MHQFSAKAIIFATSRLQANYVRSCGAGSWVRTRRWACSQNWLCYGVVVYAKVTEISYRHSCVNSTVKSSTWEPDISRGDYRSSCLLLTEMHTANLVTDRYLRPKLSQFSPVHIHFNIFHSYLRLYDWSHLFRLPKIRFFMFKCIIQLFTGQNCKYNISKLFFFFIWNIPAGVTIITSAKIFNHNQHTLYEKFYYVATGFAPGLRSSSGHETRIWMYAETI